MSDSPRADTVSFLKNLITKYQEVHIATGDSLEATLGFASNLESAGINSKALTFHAACLPSQKLALVENLKLQKKSVVMLGDGVNDGPALACADVGIAVSGGVDVALNAADVLCLKADLCGVWQLIQWSAYTQKTLTFVVSLSVFYNVVAVALALSGHMHPLVAALIMPLSSLSTAVIVYLRKGTQIWKSCTYSFPLPLPLQPEAYSSF
jgi:P-type E1-E2 ATPase